MTGHPARTRVDQGPLSADRRGAAVVLLARRARRRDPSATVWRLVSYDPATRTPVADVARRWQPAGSPVRPAAGTAAVPAAVAAWVTAVLGPAAAVGVPADDYAGPDTWHITHTDHRDNTDDTDPRDDTNLRDDGAAAGPGRPVGLGQEAPMPE